MAYIIHFLLGAGNLLPWNALITAIDYFGHLFPEKHVEKVFSVAYMSSSTLVLIIVISWRNFSRIVTFQVRMNVGFTMFCLSLMVTPLIDWSWQDVKSSTAFYVVVASVVICGLADGLIGGSLVGSAGKLPKQYMQAIFAGTASSGILVSLLRITTKASLPHDPQGLKKSAHLYFLVSTLILLVCMVFCTLLYKFPVMEQHYKLLQRDSSASRTKFWDVARMIRWPALGIFIIYTVTLSIFPGFLAENIESQLLKDWLLLYPLFTACLHGPKRLKNEVFVVFLTVILGFTNGYLTSAIMILVPKLVPPSEAEISAIVMALFLGLGLVSGSVLGWFWII
ncbi:equilibrative nucleotide transporter 8-like isoform X2 [Cynara cardunculus var. scolymus]|uniref:equilibrative nucleotide transporter 8-like isoform X2 n=1 Tax=Cynara cardunculus var. scolymus TaxID=59895 RepID=UPI000D62A775|nr:equilibrative nucleotide transporter 8-like isoform X2 [Cynara cardunculus var. scolymus]